MRAYSSVGAWFLLGSIGLACSGTTFTEGDAGGGSGGSGDSSSGGVLNRAGHTSGGAIGKGGKSSGGSDAAGTDAGGTDTGGTDSGGTSSTGGGSMGGDVSVGGDVVTAGTSPTGGSAGTSSGPPVDLVCPKSQPSNGALCKDGLTCSYGTDIRFSCRNMAKCDGGKWTVEKPNCEGLHSCADNVKNDVLCDPQAPQCIYDSSQLCVCTSCANAGPCQVDTYKWACAGSSGGAACPVIPPNLGQACGGEVSCPYGSCAAGNNMTASCNKQTWSWEQNPCPLAAQ